MYFKERHCLRLALDNAVENLVVLNDAEKLLHMGPVLAHGQDNLYHEWSVRSRRLIKWMA